MGNDTRTEGSTTLCAAPVVRLQVDHAVVSAAVIAAWHRFATSVALAMIDAVSEALMQPLNTPFGPPQMFVGVRTSVRSFVKPAAGEPEWPVSGSLLMRPATAGNSTFEFSRS